LSKVILIFIDGLGIGIKNPETNPCARKGIRYLSNCKDNFSKYIHPKNGLVFSTDTTLGVAGLPQSATGQATLLTGMNCAEHIGRHLPGFPNEEIRSILRNHSLLKQVKERGYSPIFINAFRPLFFRLPTSIRWHLSATTVAALSADLDFFHIKEISEKRSIYHDFTNHALIQKGYELPVFTPEDAATILSKSLREFDLILYEYFMTDRAGHAQRMEKAFEEILKIDQLIDSLLLKIDLDQTWLIVASDHGNIEDLTTHTHTKNPAMTIIWNNRIKQSKVHIRTLMDMVPFIMKLY